MATLNQPTACRICKGQQKTRCMICGHKAPKGEKKAKKKKKEDWTHEDYRAEFLLQLWQKAAKFNMDPERMGPTAAEVIAMYGPWPRIN